MGGTVVVENGAYRTLVVRMGAVRAVVSLGERNNTLISLGRLEHKDVTNKTPSQTDTLTFSDIHAHSSNRTGWR